MTSIQKPCPPLHHSPYTNLLNIQNTFNITYIMRKGADTNKSSSMSKLFSNHIFHKWFQKYKYNSRLNIISFLLYLFKIIILHPYLRSKPFRPRDRHIQTLVYLLLTDVCVCVCVRWVGGILQSNLSWTQIFCRRCFFHGLILQFCDGVDLYTIALIVSRPCGCSGVRVSRRTSVSWETRASDRESSRRNWPRLPNAPRTSEWRDVSTEEETYRYVFFT